MSVRADDAGTVVVEVWPLFMRRRLAARYVGGEPIMRELEEYHELRALAGTQDRIFSRVDLTRAAARLQVDGWRGGLQK